MRSAEFFVDRGRTPGLEIVIPNDPVPPDTEKPFNGFYEEERARFKELNAKPSSVELHCETMDFLCAAICKATGLHDKDFRTYDWFHKALHLLSTIPAQGPDVRISDEDSIRLIAGFENVLSAMQFWCEHCYESVIWESDYLEEDQEHDLVTCLDAYVKGKKLRTKTKDTFESPSLSTEDLLFDCKRFGKITTRLYRGIPFDNIGYYAYPERYKCNAWFERFHQSISKTEIKINPILIDALQKCKEEEAYKKEERLIKELYDADKKEFEESSARMKATLEANILTLSMTTNLLTGFEAVLRLIKEYKESVLDAKPRPPNALYNWEACIPEILCARFPQCEYDIIKCDVNSEYKSQCCFEYALDNGRMVTVGRVSSTMPEDEYQYHIEEELTEYVRAATELAKKTSSQSYELWAKAFGLWQQCKHCSGNNKTRTYLEQFSEALVEAERRLSTDVEMQIAHPVDSGSGTMYLSPEDSKSLSADVCDTITETIKTEIAPVLGQIDIRDRYKGLDTITNLSKKTQLRQAIEYSWNNFYAIQRVESDPKKRVAKKGTPTLSDLARLLWDMNEKKWTRSNDSYQNFVSYKTALYELAERCVHSFRWAD